MNTDDQQPLSEREQTDESLRLERERADHAFDDDGQAIDDMADEVIQRARERADRLLAVSRAKTDRKVPHGVATPQAIERERVLEDRVLGDERATADEILRQERADHVALLEREREDTDNDLGEERARADEALATRDEFLGIVSHELRNMLNAMVGSAAAIAKGVTDEGGAERMRTEARRIQRSGARMTRLIGDLVDVASIEAGKLAVTPEIGDPADVVKEAVEIFQPQALAGGVSLVAEIASPLTETAFDSSRILQVLTNLLSNALKFTPPQGTVVVRVEAVDGDIRFAVSDTGSGIPSDKLDAVFVRFLQIARNDRRGVGLGLYISKAIVNGHGGRIWAESKLGVGSTFFFTIPANTAA